MAHDLLFGKTTRDWSCGKSAAELWDEAESQRLHKPVHIMAPETSKVSKVSKRPDLSNPDQPNPEQSETPWVWILGIGAAVAAGVGLTVKSASGSASSAHPRTRS